MKKKLEEMLSRLDSLKAKKSSLVEQRNTEKEAVEKARKEMGEEVMSGVSVAKAGSSYFKSKEKIEVLNSAVDALALNISELEKEIHEEEEALKKSEVVKIGEEADKLFQGLLSEIENVIKNARSLTLLEKRARALGVGLSGEAVRHFYGENISQDMLNTLRKLSLGSESVKKTLKKLG